MILANMFKLAGYGALFIVFIMIANWSLTRAVEVKSKYKHNKKSNFGYVPYTLGDILAFSIYFIVWGSIILFVFLIIGAFVNFIYEMIMLSISFEPIAVTLFGPLIL